MHRIRVTALANTDPTEELRRLSIFRRDLYAHSPVEIDPDSLAYQARRDEQNRAYFEFSTDYVNEVREVQQNHDHGNWVAIEEVAGPAGEPCLNCGYVSGTFTPSQCPNCNFRDISACPHCHEEVARQEYRSIAGDLFRCPRCDTHVRLHFNDPLIRSDGRHNEPVVIVEVAAEQPV